MAANGVLNFGDQILAEDCSAVQSVLDFSVHVFGEEFGEVGPEGFQGCDGGTSSGF